jgi:hypothetical protein
MYGLKSRLTSYLAEFINLIDIPLQLFRCPCGDSPDVISMDGIVLSVESARIWAANWSTPWKDEQVLKHRATTRTARGLVLVNNSMRVLVKSYVTVGLSAIEYDTLKDDISKSSVVLSQILNAMVVITSSVYR